MMRALELRGMVGLLRAPDRVVDHLLAEFTGTDPDPITGDFDLARAWCARFTDLELVGPVELGQGLVGIDARVDGERFPCKFAAEHVAIPACFAGLSRFINVLMRTPVNNS
jgi:hypothetical protein